MSLEEVYRAKVARGEIVADPAQQLALTELQRIIDATSRPARSGWFRRRAETVPGLYLWGPVGRGKSMLMDLFVEHAKAPTRRIHFHEFMQEVHAGVNAARAKGVADAIRPVAEAAARDLRIIALDEMEIVDIADAMIVGRFFEVLFDQGVTLVTTSNRPPEDLYKDGLNRSLFLPFIDLVRRNTHVLALDGGRDYRRDALADAERWIVPPDAHARERLDKAWADLTGGAPPAPLTLRVKGRDVTLPAFANGVARARFADLCAQPLGPADYLAIASAIRVLILEDIPQLGRTNFNEARRFVTLIDTLYEARVMLLASASAEPEMLYVEGEGSFEFARTASRLSEMRAASWGDNRNSEAPERARSGETDR